MFMKRLLPRWPVFALSLMGLAATPAFASAFGTVDFPGATETFATGINVQGEIVGYYVANNQFHGFLLDSGGYHSIDVPGPVQTTASGINDRGQIVGGFCDSATCHGFLLENGAFTSIDVPGGDYTYAERINASGEIVGVYRVGTLLDGFLLARGVFTTIDPPGATPPLLAVASGINARGQIAGYFYSATSSAGFLLDHGAYTTLIAPKSAETYAYDINDLGEVVGRAFFPDVGFRAFLFEGGVFTPLDLPVTGLSYSSAIGINVQGQIVGDYAIGSGPAHGFLFIP